MKKQVQTDTTIKGRYSDGLRVNISVYQLTSPPCDDIIPVRIEPRTGRILEFKAVAKCHYWDNCADKSLSCKAFRNWTNTGPNMATMRQRRQRGLKMEAWNG